MSRNCDNKTSDPAPSESFQRSEREASYSEYEDKLAKRLYPSLSIYEISIYTATWCFGVYLAIYNLYVACNAVSRDLYMVDLVPAWWKIGKPLLKQDISDHEWETWKNATKQVGLLVILQPVLSQIMKRNHNLKPFLVTFSVLYSVIITMYLLGVLATMYLFLQITILFIAYLTSSVKVVWVSAVFYVLAPNFYPLANIKDYIFPNYESQAYQGYLTSVTSSWITARCVSFSLDRIWGDVSCEESVIQSFLKLTAYCLYLPTQVMGPLITYKKHEQSLHVEPREIDKKWLLNVVIQTFRYFVWFCVTDISLFFLYQQSLTMHPRLVNNLNLWALCGMGYCLGQFFQLKYVVMYGWSSHLSRIDDIDAPPHPKCIGRIHLYSDMWRYFDNGLYIFLQKYLYIPLLSVLPGSGLWTRLMSSILCFSFIYVWHGLLDFVFIWSCLNFVGITCEAVAKFIGQRESYQALENRLLSSRGKRRFHALVASPLFIMSALSNFYFFTGVEVGHIFARRVLLEMWPKGFPTLMFFMYCCSQTAIEIKNYEIKKQIMALRNLKD